MNYKHNFSLNLMLCATFCGPTLKIPNTSHWFVFLKCEKVHFMWACWACRLHTFPPTESNTYQWVKQNLLLTEKEQKGFKLPFTYCFKSHFILHQLLLTENAILCQKVDWERQKKKTTGVKVWGSVFKCSYYSWTIVFCCI